MNSTLKDSVVLISSFNEKYKDVIGTGFVIYREAETTYLLTCAHVIEDVGGEDNVKIYDQQATVIATSDVKDFDLAIVKVKHEKLIKRSVLGLDLENSRQEGTSVKIAGYYHFSTTKKDSLQTIKGVLRKKKSREDQHTGERAEVWEIDIENEDKLQKGNSGSPVVDKNTGFVIGVVTDMYTGGQKGTMISIEAIETLKIIIDNELRFKEKLKKYNKLLCFLETSKWEKADEETARLMIQIGDKEEKKYLNLDDILNFPCEELRMINDLWLQNSDGKFGFTVQKQIWLDCGGRIGEYEWEPYRKFAEKVKWWNGGWWNGDRSSIWSINYIKPIKGHLPFELYKHLRGAEELYRKHKKNLDKQMSKSTGDFLLKSISLIPHYVLLEPKLLHELIIKRRLPIKMIKKEYQEMKSMLLIQYGCFYSNIVYRRTEACRIL